MSEESCIYDIPKKWPVFRVPSPKATDQLFHYNRYLPPPSPLGTS